MKRTMRNGSFPYLTVVTALLAVIVFLLPEELQAQLVFNRSTVLGSTHWQLLSAHLVHGDVSHLLWDVLALCVIGPLLERSSQRAWLIAMGFGILSVNGFLLSGLSTVQFYCGLSGVLNTLLFVLLWRLWCEQRSGTFVTLAVICLGKIVLEIINGDALLTSIAWPPYPEAHLAGVMGALLYVASSRLVARKSTGCQSCLNEMRRVEACASSL